MSLRCNASLRVHSFNTLTDAISTRTNDRRTNGVWNVKRHVSIDRLLVPRLRLLVDLSEPNRRIGEEASVETIRRGKGRKYFEAATSAYIDTF